MEIILVLEDVKCHAAIAVHHTDRYMEMLTENSAAKQRFETDRQKRELALAKAEKVEVIC